MRVTNNMMIMNMMRNVNSNLNLMERYQEQLATGKAVNKPHEGPVEVSKVLRYTTEKNELEQYASNANDALSWIQSTEGAIKDINDVLQRARELTVQGANGTLATEDRQKISQELAQLKQELITNANATHAGKFLFSGYQTDRKLFNEDGTYNIDVTQAQVTSANKTVYELGRGESLDVSTNGINIFGHLPLNTITATTVPTDTVAGVPAAKEALKVNLNLEADYSTDPTNDPMEVSFNGTVYSVDAATLANLDGTTETNITPELKQELKTEIVSALRSAKNGTDSLSEIADIYFNDNDELVIKSRTYGDLTGGITFTSTPAPTNIELVEGSDVDEAEITGTEALVEAEIDASTGTEKMLITLNGEQHELAIDMDGLANAEDYKNAIQSEINGKFGLTGTGDPKIEVTINADDELVFSTANTEAGKVPRLSVQPIKAYESELLTDFDDMITALNTSDDAGIQDFLGKLDVQMDNLMAIWGDVGARTNRLELITERINETQVNITSLLSDAEDVDMAEAIMYLKNAENVYRASLSAGARIIQPTLMDFLR